MFISTHGQELHDARRVTLARSGFEIIADAGMRDTYSLNGLTVARRADLAVLGPVRIALKGVDGVRGI